MELKIIRLDNPIKINWYDSSSSQHLKRPVILPSPDRHQCIQFKNCSFIHIENLEIRHGKIYFTFGNLINQSTHNELFGGFFISNVYMHNIYTGDSSKSSIEFNVLGNNIKIENISIENCEFEGIACHAILLRTSQTIYLDNNANIFKNVIIKNNQIRNTSSTAILLNHVTHGLIELNKITRAGKFLTSDISTKGSSGVTIENCSNVKILKNEITSCFGEIRSTAVYLKKNNHSIHVNYNICRDNAGGFISVMGGNTNITIEYNISFNDGCRAKHISKESTVGRTVTVSDFNKWSYTRSENIYISNINVILSKNVFVNILSNPVTFAFFGKHTGIHVRENSLLTNNTKFVEVTTNDLNEDFIIKDNISNVSWNSIVQQNFKSPITSNELNNSNNIQKLQTEITFESSLIVFLEILKRNDILEHILDISQLFEKTNDYINVKHKTTAKNNTPKLFCMFCYAPRKVLSLMEYLAANDQIVFLNERLAKEFKTSRWEITSWFSDPSRILHNTLARQLLKLTDESEHRALISLLRYISLTIKEDSILLLGEQFVMSGTEIFNYFYDEMNNFLEINSIFLVDNLYDDLKFKAIKRIENSSIETIKNFNINHYIQHCSTQFFPQIETLVGSLYTQLSPEHFFLIDFQQHILTETFNAFWKRLSHLCPANFKKLIKRLSQSESTTQSLIFDERCADPVFLQYIVNDLKNKSTEQQKIELTEIIEVQTKYKIQTEKHTLINIKKELADKCKTHLLNLERLGEFNYFGNTSVFYKKADNTTDYIKTNYYKINLHLLSESIITSIC